MSSSGPFDLPPPGPGPLPPGKGSAAATPPPARTTSPVLDLRETPTDERPTSPPGRPSRLPVVAFAVIAALLVTIIVLLQTGRSDDTAAPPATLPSAEPSTPADQTVASNAPATADSAPVTTASEPRAPAATNVDADRSARITQAASEQVADEYLDVSSAADPDAFVRLWTYPADHYGEQLDATGMRAAAVAYFSSNPQRSFRRLGPVSMSPGPSDVVVSFDYEFDLTRADGQTRCGVRRLTLRLVGDTDVGIAAANETKVSDCA